MFFNIVKYCQNLV